MASGATTVLEAKGVSKAFFGAVALDNVNFELRSGEVHALLGENGAGKSTLIKCLTGAYHRDSGSLFLDGAPIDPRDTFGAQALGIGTVYQEVNLLQNLTVAENLYLGRQPTRFGFVETGKMNRNASKLLADYDLEIDVGLPLASFSVAVQQIVAIARAVDLSGKVLILDEPTASLDTHEVAVLFRIINNLKNRGLGIVFITHFLDQVYAVSDRMTVLRNGRLIATRDKAGLARKELVSLMLGKEFSEDVLAPVAASTPVGEPRFKFSGVGKKGKIKPFDLDVHAGEVVGLAGLLGAGRTETAEVLFGARAADSGEIIVDGAKVSVETPQDAIGLGFGFCPEDRKLDGIVGDLSVRENIVLALQARQGWVKPLSRNDQNALADKYIAALDIRTEGREKPIKLLSGGNQQKVMLARWLATEPRFLILDEPTRGIDVGAHAEIIRLIRELCAGGMSLLVISSEIEELIAYSSRIRVLRDHEHVAELSAGQMTASAIVNAIAASTTEGDRS